ncbi:peptidase S16 [Rheinheimera riviphila]|uniref:Peptidase S16 n=1 Tax=Rheinheimera riviphila TaxID=1834037 RepID=A0A437R359_9GAMM|nr:LON peptidase substrate-binding domain-containing protein [Rheinheimera riviphila]RVU41201.1 peptidase S16 [Rheinheimera riviphila]
MTEVALFPLSQVVLPGGRMKLRVFEPRYIRLVREACAGGRPFVSALLNPYVAQTHPDRIFPLATLVQITDFTQLDDGLLGITIEGLQRVELADRWQETDGLHVANGIVLPDWQETPFLPSHQQLTQELKTVFAQNPQLESMYPKPHWQDATWLAQRWIEILTMPPPLKYQLMAADNATPALDALCSWLQQQDSE